MPNQTNGKVWNKSDYRCLRQKSRQYLARASRAIIWHRWRKRSATQAVDEPLPYALEVRNILKISDEVNSVKEWIRSWMTKQAAPAMDGEVQAVSSGPTRRQRAVDGTLRPRSFWRASL